MSGILEFLWESAVQSAAIFAVIIVLRRALKGRLGPRLRYALWGLLLLRLLLPLPVINSPMSLMNAVEPASQAVRQFAAPTAIPEPPAGLRAETPAGASAAAFGWPQALAAVWLAGAAATAGCMAAANVRFLRRSMRGARPMRLTREFMRTQRLSGVRRAIPLYVSDQAPSPCLVGLARPKVLLTPQAARMPGRLRHIYLHELCHYKQGDNWIALLRNIACAVHWFNPLVWAAAHMSRRDCEMACDAQALKYLGSEENLDYGETLVRLLRGRPRASLMHAATTMAAGPHEMKQRLHTIVQRPRTPAVAATATLLVSAALAAVACTGAAATTNPPATPAISAPAAGQPTASATATGSLPPSPSPLPADTPAAEPAKGGQLLWQQDGWEYWLESREGERDTPGNYPGAHIARLYRVKDGSREDLDELVELSGGRATVLPAGDRIVFYGYAGTKVTDMKVTQTIVSIKPDGTDRRVFMAKFHVARNLCYDSGYLYYEGWTNDRAFPRPVNRLNPDLTGSYKMADIDGAFLLASGGYAYFVHKKETGIYRVGLNGKARAEFYTDSTLSTACGPVVQTGENEYEITGEGTTPFRLVIE